MDRVSQSEHGFGRAADGDGDAPITPSRAAAVAKVPLGREGTPAEVAAVARMLVSDGGAYVNGQMLQVNGGAQT